MSLQHHSPIPVEDNAVFETRARLRVVKSVAEELRIAGVSSAILVGSMAWGSNYAVNDSSDIEIYVIGSMRGLARAIERAPEWLDALEDVGQIFETFTTHRSQLGISYFGVEGSVRGYDFTARFIPESEFSRLCQSEPTFPPDAGNYECSVGVIKSHKPKAKVFRSFTGSILPYTCEVDRRSTLVSPFLLHRQPIILIHGRECYGTTFLSHILTCRQLFRTERVASDMTAILGTIARMLVYEIGERTIGRNRIGSLLADFSSRSDRIPPTELESITARVLAASNFLSSERSQIPLAR